MFVRHFYTQTHPHTHKGKAMSPENFCLHDVANILMEVPSCDLFVSSEPTAILSCSSGQQPESNAQLGTMHSAHYNNEE